MDSPQAPRNPRSDGFGYNPRCIKRDISNYLTQLYATTDKTAALITSSRTIATFQDVMQGATGVHGAGHFTVAGDPGSDFYTSPGGEYHSFSSFAASQLINAMPQTHISTFITP